MEKVNVSIGNKIKELQDYFINKVIIGDYEIIKIGEHTTLIKIDDLYEFSMWTASGKDSYDFFETSFLANNININMKGLKSKGWVHMKKHLTGEVAKKAKREKMKEFNRLKKELNITCNG
tara:strand:+ start:5224 stop:5583 length:360 start_codon:yes stop_codon:yes gene_type:complete